MKQISIIISTGATLLFLASCVSRATSTYPSYEKTMAKYSPPEEGVPLSDPAYESPKDCDCPRVWYRDQWVYHCDGEWIYWHHGYWYYYPHFYLYYYEGTPHVHRGTSRSIRKR